MLGYLFLFHGRMGRLQYALWAWLFVPLIFILAFIVGGFVIAFGVGLHYDDLKTAMFALAGLLFAVLTWMELSLQAVRIRDIGWKAGAIIPIVIAVNFIDLGVAYAIPALADDTGLHTIVPSVLWMLYAAVLLFTPTDGQEILPFIIPGLSLPRIDLDFFRGGRPKPAVAPKPREQAVEQRRYPREKVPFGRRGLT